MNNKEFNLYYAVCQYVPDPIRKEAVNVGLVYHIPTKKFSKFYHIRSKKRLLAFDDECNSEIIDTMYDSLSYVFDNSDNQLRIDLDDNFSDISESTFLPSRTKYYVNTFRFLPIYSMPVTSESLDDDITLLKKTFLHYDYKPENRITDAEVTAFFKRHAKSKMLNNEIKKAEIETRKYNIEKVFDFQTDADYIKVMVMNYSREWALSNKIKTFLYDLDSVKDEIKDKNIVIITGEDNVSAKYKDWISSFKNELSNYSDNVKIETADSYLSSILI